MVVALVFFVEHISETGKSIVHTTPAMVLFFFHRKISTTTTSQQTTLEAISRDIEHRLTCYKDQYFQENFDPCLAGAKYFF
jgi:hypothetical protein